jgi:hypothetical protein
VRRLVIGRLAIADMPASGKLDLDVDLKAKTLTATPRAGSCVNAIRARFEMAGQDMEGRIGEAALCAAGSPLLTTRWGEAAATDVAGDLAARSGRYRLGRTVFDGLPPQINFTLDYAPADQETRVSGNILGGKAVLNNALILSEARGTFEGHIVREQMTANIVLATMRIAQNAATESVAPVAVSGQAALAGDIARFDFNVKTPRGAALGRGEGVHAVRTGIGEAIFDSGILTFARSLQPDGLVPALRGVISRASGAAEGRVRFAWTPNAQESSATVALNSVSFQGPGVAVTRTEGVTGKIVFSSLSPVTTAGEQTISIAKIDLDALKLENGTMRFSLPGDGAMKIVEAEYYFPLMALGRYHGRLA